MVQSINLSMTLRYLIFYPQLMIILVYLSDSLNDGIFQIGEVEGDGRRSIRSLTGLRRDSEVMYVGTLSVPGNHQRGKIPDAFIVEDEDAQDGEDGPRKSGLMRYL